MTGRELHEEWVGRTPRSAVPEKVIHRLLDRCNGHCQGPCGQRLVAGCWDTDHIVPLEDWQGEGHGNRESNLQILCTKVCHRPKTSLEAALRAKSRNTKAAMLFPKKYRKKHPVRGWRRMDGTPVYNPNWRPRGGRNT